MESKQQHEPEALVDMRTHLTVVTLAVSQLRRRHRDIADVDRLCSYAETAIAQIKEAIANMEASLPQRESGNGSLQERARSRSSPPGDVDRLGTGPMDLPSRVPKDDTHDQETRAIHLPVNLPNNRPS